MNPLSVIAGLAGTIITRLFPDKSEAAKAEMTLLMQQEMNIALAAQEQMKVNAVEAASTSVFVAGWRPFIGWICGSAFAWVYLVQPILIFLLAASGNPIPVLPALDVGMMLPVLLGLLGLGGLRTFEKTRK